MSVKTVLYIFVVPLVIWSLESFNIDRFFKKSHVWQIRFFYLFLSLALSYLTVNFFYDFFLSSKFI